jgi:hypothetical protein
VGRFPIRGVYFIQMHIKSPQILIYVQSQSKFVIHVPYFIYFVRYQMIYKHTYKECLVFFFNYLYHAYTMQFSLRVQNSCIHLDDYYVLHSLCLVLSTIIVNYEILYIEFLKRVHVQM